MERPFFLSFGGDFNFSRDRFQFGVITGLFYLGVLLQLSGYAYLIQST